MTFYCNKCGKTFQNENLDGMPDSIIEQYQQSGAYCPECSSAAAAKSAEKEKQDELDELKRRMDERYKERLAESQLDTYALDFDPAHPKANRELMKWMLQHVDDCVWIVGESGSGKTRIMQEAARIAARDRSLRYWPVADLAARLLETAKRPEGTLWDCYGSDLLILDDLGKESLTAARIAAIEAIVDHRYIGYDQTRRRQGVERPTFGLAASVSKKKLGGQIWITSQIDPNEVAARLSAVNREDATAIVRRLSEICVLHRA